MARLAYEPTAEMTALIEGELTIQNGCLTIAGEYPIVVFPSRYSVQAINGVWVLYELDHRVGQIGEMVTLGGGEGRMPDAGNRDLDSPIPAACLSDPITQKVWFAGSRVGGEGIE